MHVLRQVVYVVPISGTVEPYSGMCVIMEHFCQRGGGLLNHGHTWYVLACVTSPPLPEKFLVKLSLQPFEQ